MSPSARTGPRNSARDPADRAPVLLVVVVSLVALGFSVSSGLSLAAPGLLGVHAAPHGPGAMSGSSSPLPASVPSANPSTGSIITTIPVQSAPTGIVFDPANGHLFVADMNSNNLSDINGATNTVTATVNLPVQAGYPAGPGYMLFDSANGYVYVGDQGNYAISVINGATDANVSWLQEPQGWDFPYRLALDPTSGIIYFTNGGAGVTVGGVAVDGISGLNTASNTYGYVVTTGTFFTNWPQGICYAPTSGDLYVGQGNTSGSGPSNLVVVSAASNSIVAQLPTTDANTDCTYDSASNLVFDMAGSEGLLAIDPSTNTITSTLAGQGNGNSLTFDSANGYIYETLSNYLSTYNGSTDQEVGTLDVCGASGSATALDAAVDSANGDIYVTCAANTGSSYVTVVDPSGTSGGGNTLTSVSITINPSSASIATQATATLTATPVCSGGTCPGGATYTWALSAPSLGTFSAPTAATTTFTAGTTSGTEVALVSVTLGGVTKTNTQTITIGNSGGNPGGGSTGTGSGGGTLLWVLIGVGAVAVVAAVAFVVLKVLPKRGKPSTPSATPATPGYPVAPPPPAP